MKQVWRALAALALLVLLVAFASAHFGQRVTLRLGLVTWSDVPLPVVVYGAVVLGMAFMFLVGLRADVRTRRLLERYEAMAELERAARAAASSAPAEEAGSADAAGPGRPQAAGSD